MLYLSARQAAPACAGVDINATACAGSGERSSGVTSHPKGCSSTVACYTMPSMTSWLSQPDDGTTPTMP